MAGLTLLRVVSNEEMERQERARLEQEVQARQNSDLLLGLAALSEER